MTQGSRQQANAGITHQAAIPAQERSPGHCFHTLLNIACLLASQPYSGFQKECANTPGIIDRFFPPCSSHRAPCRLRSRSPQAVLKCESCLVTPPPPGANWAALATEALDMRYGESAAACAVSSGVSWDVGRNWAALPAEAADMRHGESIQTSQI